MIHKKQLVMTGMVVSILALLPACWPFDKVVVIEKEKKPSLYVINVLDKANYDDCRIAGSINVPFENVEAFVKDLNKESEIVLYCSNYMCTASGAAAQRLKELGFEHVYAYEGGSAEWYQLSLTSDKYSVEGTCKASYLTALNEKPEQPEALSVAVISAEDLYNKMVNFGVLPNVQKDASKQDNSQVAA